MRHDIMPQYQPDYLISWDFSDHDFPCVSISCIERDEKGTHVIAKFIGVSHEKSGVISLRQVVEQRDSEDRREKERLNNLKQFHPVQKKEESEINHEQKSEN